MADLDISFLNSLSCFLGLIRWCTSARSVQNDECVNEVLKINFSRPSELVRVKRQLASQEYYDFLINEFSFKVWAVFEVVTIALLFYSTFAAIYYAKWTYLRTEPTEEDNLLRRSIRTVTDERRILRAIQTPPT